MAGEVDSRSMAGGGSPLALFIRQKMESERWTYDDLVQNARARKLRASSEVFRKAANDGHRTPLRPATVTQLAAGLHETEAQIRDLDNLRWGTGSGVVSAFIEDPSAAFVFRRPPGMTDQEWARFRRSKQAELDALFDEYSSD